MGVLCCRGNSGARHGRYQCFAICPCSSSGWECGSRGLPVANPLGFPFQPNLRRRDKISRNIRFCYDSDYPTAQSQTGRIRLRIRAASENPDILTANSAPAPSGPPTSTSVIITGKAPGRASVSVTAVDERFSPTPPVPDWNQSSFTVEVIRCHYSVNGFVTWVTTIEGAHVMFTAQLEQISLESEDGRVFHPAGYPRAPVAIKWGATVNRVRGCRADYQSFPLLYPPPR